MDHIDLNILNTLPTKRVLTLDVARLLAEAALKAAAEKNINYLVISIVDDGGYLITLSRQSGAELAAVEIGIAKTRTAAITRKPTQWWTDQLHNGVYAFLAMPGVTRRAPDQDRWPGGRRDQHSRWIV
jgi:uncharacterized protein GlcG (DUF336 family)